LKMVVRSWKQSRENLFARIVAGMFTRTEGACLFSWYGWVALEEEKLL